MLRVVVGNARTLATVIVLAMLVVGVGAISLARLRLSLLRAREHCSAISPGTTRADATRELARTEGAMELGASFGALGVAGPPEAVDVGRRGAIASWQCELSLDPSATHVTVTHFGWWIAPDFHGSWDDDAREWLEANAL